MPDKIASMKKAGEIGKHIFRRLQFILEPGITTKAINAEICKYMKSVCNAAFLGYKTENSSPFPYESCISINEEVCHGTPSDRVVGGGDLVSVDLGIEVDGYITDACRTFEVGEISEEADLLNYWTKTALRRAIRTIKAGICWQDVARIIENTAIKHKLNVVKSMNGHGVGAKLHEEPILRNYVCAANELIVLKEGQTIAVEPMFSVGSGDIEVAKNGWTILTKDRSLSSHWEHTLLVTSDGCEALL